MPDNEIPREIVDERSGVHFIPVASAAKVQGRNGAERLWKWAALVLTTLLAAGALASSFGRAFYVSRTEYTERVQGDAVTRENMRGTLERLSRAMDDQAAAFRVLAGEVSDMKVELGVLRKKR